jgi:hypothetical protein
MKRTDTSLKKLVEYLLGFIKPWEYYVSSDSGTSDKSVKLYWKKHKRTGKYFIYKKDII